MQFADVNSLKSKLSDLEKKSSGENIWDDQSFAQSLMQQIASVREQISEVEGLEAMLGDIDAAAEVASMEVPCTLQTLELPSSVHTDTSSRYMYP